MARVYRRQPTLLRRKKKPTWKTILLDAISLKKRRRR